MLVVAQWPSFLADAAAVVDGGREQEDDDLGSHCRRRRRCIHRIHLGRRILPHAHEP